MECDRPNIVDERARSERALRAIGSTTKASLGDLVRLVAYCCRTPLAVFLYGDEQPQAIWAIGERDGPEPPPPVAFAHETAARGDLVVVADARADPRFADDPLVTRPPFLRAYAGVPVVRSDGRAIGTLCVMDRTPRRIGADEERALRLVARELFWKLENLERVDELSRSQAALDRAEAELRRAHEELEERVRQRTAELEAAYERQEAEVRQREAILDSIQDSFVALDREWRFQYVNRAAAEFFRRDPQSLLGKFAWSEYPTADSVRRACEQALREQRVVTLEDYYAPLDRYFEARMYPTRDGVTAFFSDVTARKRAENESRRARLALEAVLDHMVEGVIACDADARLTFANAAGLHFLGLDEEQPVAVDLRVVFDRLKLRRPDGRPLTVEDSAIGAALAGQTVREAESVQLDPAGGGDRVRRTNATPLRDAAGAISGVVLVSHDVTELVELDRLKDEFVSVAAHELKTPVTIVKSYAELLGQSGDDADRRGAIIAAICRGAERIARIVTTVLELSQLNLGALQLHPRPFALDELVRTTVARWAGEHVTVAAIAPARVHADPTRVRETLVALLANATKFSQPRGAVEVSLAVENGRATVAVRDRGVGIPVDRQERIFERFYRAHTDTPHDKGGMGVSLHLSRELIARQGGSMWFQSEEGRGSTFYFALPLA